MLLRGRLFAEKDGQLLGEVRPGETVGEIGVIIGEPRNATVRAVRASTVLRIAADALDALVRLHPELGLSVARTMIERERRAAQPRHPALVPGVICLVALTEGIDLSGLAANLAATGAVDATVLDASDGRVALEAAEAPGRFVLVLADRADPEAAAAALGSADEVVMVADAVRGDPEPGEADAWLASVLPDAPLPRRTLLMMQSPDVPSPLGTAGWLDGRRIDRHLHMRPGHAGDRGRVARLLFGRAVGLVLAGGGARGAAHLGAIRALADRGIVPDVIGGTSIGAAMAAWHAMGLRGRALEEATKEVFVAHGSPTSDWTALPFVSLVKGEKTRRLGRDAVRRATGADADVEDTWSPYFAVAADFTLQRQAILTRGPLWRTLAATYAIPGVLPPVVIAGSLHVDGGVVNNLPVDVLEGFDVAHTIAVDLLGDPSRKVEIEDMPTGRQMLRDRFRPRRKRHWRVPGTITTLLTATVLGSLERQRRMRARADLCLRPDLPRIGLLDWARFEDAIELGYASCSAQLDALDPALVAKLRTEE